MKTFRKVSVVAVLASLLAGSSIALAPTAHAQPFQAGQYYHLIAVHSNKALDIADVSTSPGAILQQWDQNPNGQNQHFRFESSGGGYYRVIARHSNLALDVFEWNADNGADIVQWTDLDGENQQWTVVDRGNNEISLVNRFSGKALDVWEWSTANGGRLSQYDDTGGDNQRFRLVPVDGGGQPPSPPPPSSGARQMENLDRGVVAVRRSNSQVLVTWRLLGLDPSGIGFNVYRSTAGGSATRLNSNVLTGGTNFVDSTANLGQANSYHVRPVVNGQEQAASGSFTLRANNPVEPVVRVPIRNTGPVKFVWVGDLTGNGEYDYVLDRQTSPQRLEAYRSDGTFLWDVDMGPNSTNQDNISPGSSTVNVGHNDGVTVYDFDGDGRAEVAVRIANGVRFGNGQTFSHSNNNVQFIAFLDGQTGALRAAEQVPTDYLSNGPLAARFGVGYLDGVRPHLIAYKKNRLGGAGTGFNLMQTAWTFDGNSANMEWKWLRGNQNAPDGHNSRSIDVNGDGRDEVVEQGFVLNGDGSLRYSLGPQGVVHGDRFHVAKMDPNRPGLQGYQVQQDNPSGLREFYYDARDGSIIWRRSGPCCADVGRGMAGSIDPRFPGMEVWSFDGVINAPTNQLTEPNTSLRPWPHLGLWWDGDAGIELFNDGKIEKWDWNNPTPTNSLPRLVTTWNYGAVTTHGPNPAFVGDIFGDWREEVVLTNSNSTELIIFTTDIQSDIRLYTLAHNPAYRNAMTFKGYVQSHHVDYYLGFGMSQPPQPNIFYAGT